MTCRPLRPRPRHSFLISAAAIALGISAAGLAWAGPVPEPPRPADPCAAGMAGLGHDWTDAAIWAPGFFIAIDPESHLPTTPSEAQKRAAAAAAQAQDALLAPLGPLPVVRLPHGGEMVRLQGRYQVYSVARRDASGHIVTECAPDPEIARKMLSAQPAKPETKWEEK